MAAPVLPGALSQGAAGAENALRRCITLRRSADRTQARMSFSEGNCTKYQESQPAEPSRENSPRSGVLDSTGGQRRLARVPGARRPDPAWRWASVMTAGFWSAPRCPISLTGAFPAESWGIADATELSLAENTVRIAMHPADQFEAWSALIASGKTAAEVARRFGVTEQLVRQRLRLGQVSPVLLAAYRTELLTLHALKAFVLTDDFARQPLRHPLRKNANPIKSTGLASPASCVSIFWHLT